MDRLKYYRHEILKNIAAYEIETNKMWHKSELSDLEDTFYTATDSGDVRTLMRLYNTITKALDAVRGEL